MNTDTRRMIEAYLRVYGDFKTFYTHIPEDPAWADETFSNEEVAILFQTALNTSILGELLKQEIVERFMELKEADEDVTTGA